MQDCTALSETAALAERLPPEEKAPSDFCPAVFSAAQTRGKDVVRRAFGLLLWIRNLHTCRASPRSTISYCAHGWMGRGRWGRGGTGEGREAGVARPSVVTALAAASTGGALWQAARSGCVSCIVTPCFDIDIGGKSMLGAGGPVSLGLDAPISMGSQHDHGVTAARGVAGAMGSSDE